MIGPQTLPPEECSFKVLYNGEWWQKNHQKHEVTRTMTKLMRRKFRPEEAPRSASPLLAVGVVGSLLLIACQDDDENDDDDDVNAWR